MDARTTTKPSWDGLLDRLPTGVHLYDLSGTLLQANAKAQALCAPPCSAEAIDRALSGAGAAGTPVGEVLMSGEALATRELIVETSDGRGLQLVACVDPIHDDAGALCGAVACFHSIETFDGAREELRRERAWARRMFENSPVAVYWTDADGYVRAFNPAAQMLWGRRPQFGRDRWGGFAQLFHADGRPIAPGDGPMESALRDRHPELGREIGYLRADGGRGAALAYPTPLFDDAGGLVGAINMLVDITDRKQAELQHKVLLDELNHRVKNTLATIQSLAGLTFRGDAEPAAMAAAFEARLMALSKAHDQLAERRWTDVDLRGLAASVLGVEGDDRIELGGGPLWLSPRAAVTLAMALHELRANAQQFGALSTPEGRLELVWRRDEAGELELEWCESNGPRVTKPRRRGFGRRFLEGALSHELGGRTDLVFEPEGLRCTIHLPLDQDEGILQVEKSKRGGRST